MLDLLWNPGIWAALVTLTLLEIILGIDNLIVISILTDRLPGPDQSRARRIGLGFALITRIALLSLAFMVAQLEAPIFSVRGTFISWRDILLICGGIFLLAKGTLEIHEKVEGAVQEFESLEAARSLLLVVLQIVAMDIIFSFDSVMTAIGVADQLPVMIIAIVVSMVIMVLAVDKVADFINQHPTVKILGLSYMLLIGMALIGEGFDAEIPKGYLYFAMAFSFFVELINMRIRRKTVSDTSSP
ncbi:MAG: TerC family protein [Methylococcales bacterium]